MIEFIVVFLAQVGFLFFRTINVVHTSKGDVVKAIISGSFVGILWIITTGMGVSAFMDIKNGWHVIVGHILGGAVGTFYGMKSSHGKAKVR